MSQDHSIRETFYGVYIEVDHFQERRVGGG